MGDRRDFRDGESLEPGMWVPVQKVGMGSWGKRVWEQAGSQGKGLGPRGRSLGWGGGAELVGRESWVALRQGSCTGLEALPGQGRGFSWARLEVGAMDVEGCLGSLIRHGAGGAARGALGREGWGG